MELVFEITSSEQFLLGENATKTFFPVGGVIGRSPDCEWAISDQSRHLSGRHAVVSAEGENFYITDVSTNGVFINGATLPIEKGVPQLLRSEDELSMGDMTFRAVIHLDATRNGFTPTQTGIDVLGAEKAVEPVLDPLEMLRQKMPNSTVSTVPEKEPNNLLDQWHTESSSMPDSLPAIQETFNAPQMMSEQLPENWHLAETIESAPPELPNLQLRPGNRDVLSSKSLPVSPPINIAPTKTAPTKTAPTNIETPDPFSTPVGLQPALRVPSQPPIERNEASPRMPGADLHLQAFCRGLGLSMDTLGTANTEQLMEQAGQALRETFAGMVNVMKGRASLKNEFRMDMTLVQTEQNNPLKFAADETQVLKHFLGKNNESFLSIPDALQESFRDIQEHQIGVMAAVQASLTQLLDKMGPEQLEQKFDRNHGKSFSTTVKNARYWKSYRDFHHEIQQEEATFLAVFGDTFAKTYNDQVELLRTAGRNEKVSS